MTLFHDLALVVHVDTALLQRAKFEVLGRLWIQLQQIPEGFSLDIHGLCLVILLLFLVVCKCRAVRLEKDVGFQIEDARVVVEDRARRQLHESLLSLGKHIDIARLNEDYFFRLLTIRLDLSQRLVVAIQELNHKLVSEANLAGAKEIFEAIDELLEYLLYQFSLHLWWQLLVQSVLFHNQVIISVEGSAHRLVDRLGQLRRHVVRVVCLL